MDNPLEVEPLSKNALKRQRKLEKLEKKRAERKLTRKRKNQLKKEKQRLKREGPQPGPSLNSTKKERKQRLQQAREHGVRLVIDLSLAHLMTPKEVASLCRQLTIIYVENKRSEAPFHLYFTSLSGALKETFNQFSPDHEKWLMEIHEKSFLEVFSSEKESIVYLTADAEDDLGDMTTADNESVAFSKDMVLVIGGLIDRNRHKNICYKEACKNGLKTARLPLHLLEAKCRGSQVLTTNQCAEMLLQYNVSLDWRVAVQSVFPKRKLVAHPNEAEVMEETIGPIAEACMSVEEHTTESQ